MILSLDFSNNKVVTLDLDYTLLKPKKIICMSLDNIGKQCGPNYNDISISQKQYPGAEVIVSGGIKNNNDIVSLKEHGLKEVILLTSILENKIDFNLTY